ncbi:uncharacterized protein LOC123319133 [Coccinella septempunctata]|uniref:uncharacterized protein LOC123319133 n=1 Tax=Coccinella septempunctata TaxID=41139 RepID=UPI001D069893|nr:uncharacterized protein LOC123319133 [Coccinella septempunctata]
MLANQGRYKVGPPIIPGGPRELWPEFRRELKNTWIDDFYQICALKGRVYALYASRNTFLDDPWFSKINRPRRFFTVVLRLRSGHCLTPSYLHRIGLKESNLCDCGELT